MDSDVIDLRGDGRVLLYRRGKKGTFQVRVRVPNSTGFIVKTAKTAKLHEATAFATNLYDDLYIKVKQGGTLKSSPTFRAVYDEWCKFELRRDITERVAVYALPFFEKDSFDKIGSARMTEFWLHRQSTFRRKRSSPGTLLREKTAIMSIFKYAKAKGYIKDIPELNPLEISSPLKRRNTFSPKEWETITKAQVAWYEEEGVATKRDRALAAYYFQVLACTGIRVGEARSLKWSDLRLTNQYVVLSVSGKTGSREAVANQGSFIWFDTLKRYKGDGDLLFAHPDGTAIGSFKTAFHSLLRFAKVSKGSRSIYSLRHMYATERLKHGVNPYHLAKQMGTSVEMLEKHYGHVINAEMADHLNEGLRVEMLHSS